ncbi:MAG: hypothetical protein LR011_09785 [Verrucomicrobia bacterium]|nr:hypothetical protein [Verrucomicrobiota bacterium]
MTTRNAQSNSSRPDIPLPLEMGSMKVWIGIIVSAAIAVMILPGLWKLREPVPESANLRLPYDLSKDYWLYRHWMNKYSGVTDLPRIYILGDSVVWGEFVDRDATLSAHLNASRPGERFEYINAGINGLYPVALQGLVQHSFPLHKSQRLILQINLLWMSNPEADLQTSKEQSLNHVALLPQFTQKIPPYKAAFENRAGIIWTRHFPFSQWVQHLQIAYFKNKSLQDWTTDSGASWPPDYPNAHTNPMSQMEHFKWMEPQDDPSRGIHSDRHRPWFDKGMAPTSMDWVPMESSLQFRAIQNLIVFLKKKKADFFVLIGPLNAHMMDAESRAECAAIERRLSEMLTGMGVGHMRAETLPSDQYADTSHPLSSGYRSLADQLADNPDFLKWLQ